MDTLSPLSQEVAARLGEAFPGPFTRSQARHAICSANNGVAMLFPRIWNELRGHGILAPASPKEGKEQFILTTRPTTPPELS